MPKSQKEILLARISVLRGAIQDEVGSSTMDIIDELIENEIELEKECNQ